MILFVMHWIYTAANKRCRKHWHDHNRNNYIFVFISIKEFKITFVLFCFAVTLYSHDKCKPIAVLDQSMGTCTLKLQTLRRLKTFSRIVITVSSHGCFSSVLAAVALETKLKGCSWILCCSCGCLFRLTLAADFFPSGRKWQEKWCSLTLGRFSRPAKVL